jgi:hypothetical protein
MYVAECIPLACHTDNLKHQITDYYAYNMTFLIWALSTTNAIGPSFE